MDMEKPVYPPQVQIREDALNFQGKIAELVGIIDRGEKQEGILDILYVNGHKYEMVIKRKSE